jgi:hypothetical protein
MRPSSVSTPSRVLDVVAVCGLLLAATVFVTGGFREWMPWGRISVTSWIRPLLVAVAALALRHALQPRPSVFTRLRAGVRTFRAITGVREALPVATATRLGVLLVGFLAVVTFGYRPDVGAPWRMYENEFLNLPARWDTGWYLGVASEGYRWDPTRLTQQQNIAFFPVYPLLMRYGSLLLGRELMWTGVLISGVSFFGALVYLYRFTRERAGDDSARMAIALIACYPFAFFYSAAYTEALFLLLMVGACYHFERDELWKAGGWGLLAGLTRPNGCLLSVALAFIAVRPLWPIDRRTFAATFPAVVPRLAVAALPGVGMLMYSAYIYTLTGHPLQWAAQNAAWGRVYRGLDTLVADQAQLISEAGVYTFAATRTLDALQLCAVLFIVATVWPVFRRLGLAYAVLLAVNLVPPLTMGGLLSMGRVTSVLFPTFVWLALAIPVHHRTAWLATFAMLQAMCAALFFTWRPLY